jgi:hypothetical protein
MSKRTGLLAVVSVVTALMSAGVVTALATASSPGMAAAATPTLGGVQRAASLPGPADVVRGRFVEPVLLDGGVLRVVPAPAGDRPLVSKAQAAQKIWASPVLQSRQQGPLGYGLVTISLRAKGVPRVTRLLAWVGFARSSELANCPMEASGSTAQPGLSGPALTSNGYAAVVIGAAHGSPAVAYAAPSVLCGSVQAASLTQASEVVSVPWRAVTGLVNESIRVRVSMPACARVEGTSSGGSAKVSTITVDAIVPDVHGPCAGASHITETVLLGPADNPPGAPPPLVSASTIIRHGRLGPSVTTVAPPS